MYHALWADWYLPAAMPALEKLFFAHAPGGARVLDLCCGSGHVTKELVRRGYRVTGVDNSKELIAIAQASLPGIDFQVQDARDLQFAEQFDAVLSTFDSLNHILELDALGRVFSCVRHALRPGGLFVFDMNLAEAYSADLRQWTADVGENSVGLVRGTFDNGSKMARTELIWFVRANKDNLWKQVRSTVEQRCYAQSDILLALSEAGFHGIEAMTAWDAGVTSELGFGRVFFAARG